MAQQAQREGSRWIGGKPTGKQVAEWFVANAPMHAGMKAEDWVTGVVLIPAKEKIPGGEQHVWIPYIKVETRVAYFWRYVATLGDCVGHIEAADVAKLEVEGVYNMNLPPGFFRLPVQEQSGKFVHFLCCSMRVRIADDSGKTIMSAPAGTKMVSCLTKWGVDENAIMKAETGAIGRALGMAGMLTIPGSGIASAEDMQEMQAAEGRASVAVEPTLPATVAPDEQLRARIAELSVQLQSENPGAFEELELWAREKKINLDDLKPHQLRGVLRAIERKMEPVA